MTQPQGFVDHERPNYVCGLHKSHYDLKQSPKALFHRLSQYLLGLGFKESSADSLLFIRVNKSHVLMISIYVDNMIVNGKRSFPIRDRFESCIYDERFGPTLILSWC